MRPERGSIFVWAWEGITALIFMAVIVPLVGGCGDSGGASGGDHPVSLVILQTSDLHHHASGYGPQLDYTPLDSKDSDSVKGGYARLAGLIKEIRREAESGDKKVLLFDSGDFMMGTVYDLTRSDPLSFQFFKEMAYDAVTLGNHELDWGTEALSDLIGAAMESGFDAPILATNMITDTQSATDDGIESLVSSGAILSGKIVSVTSEFQVGVLGIMGSDAHSVAPLAAPLTFNHDYAFLQQKVDELRASGADMIILLSHTGVDAAGEGEDSDIAENVTGIDVIASGHLHTATPSALVKGPNGTLIFSPGEYGAYLSRLDATWGGKEKKITAHSFRLLAVDDSVAGDKAVDELVTSYHTTIAAELADMGVAMDTIISKAGFDLKMAAFQETGFADLIADAIRNAGGVLDVNDSKSFDAGVIASGVIRDAIFSGKTGAVTFSDVYNALPLGVSPYGDPLPGYPMMSVYVTAKEIRNICEVSVSAAPLMGSDFYLNFSGIRYDYNPSNPFLSRVTDLYLCGATDVNTENPGTKLVLSDETTLYRLVVNLYALSMMDVATSVGLEIIPKTKDGLPVTSESDFAALRIDISSDPGVQELKEWMALKYFLDTRYPASGEGIPSGVYGTGGTALGRARNISAG